MLELFWTHFVFTQIKFTEFNTMGRLEIIQPSPLISQTGNVSLGLILKYITSNSRSRMGSRFLDSWWVHGVCRPLYSQLSRKIISFLHCILNRKQDFPLCLIYFSLFALLSLEAGGGVGNGYKRKRREIKSLKTVSTESKILEVARTSCCMPLGYPEMWHKDNSQKSCEWMDGWMVGWRNRWFDDYLPVSQPVRGQMFHTKILSLLWSLLIPTRKFGAYIKPENAFSMR